MRIGQRTRSGSSPAGRIVWAMLALVPATLSAVSASSYPVDCFPDRVTAWSAAEPAPELRFGAAFVPGVVLGPPGTSNPFDGSFSVASLGYGGSAVVAFDDIVIEDRPGPDFIVFENAFFQQPLPASPGDDFIVFAEPGIVEVSSDGEEWFRFAYDGQALALAATQTGAVIDRALYQQLRGLAGLTPTFSGNWTVADDPGLFDSGGTGGISGAGGDAFDLADVGLGEARFVRIIDAGTQLGFAGSAEGFDLDAVIALHARPVAPVAIDSDGDRLTDRAELEIYGSDPEDDDTDGDGIDDGREVAACRSPLGPGSEPLQHLEPRLWVRDAACTELRFSFAGSGRVYDLIRGRVAELSSLSGSIDLGVPECLADDHLTLRWSCDAAPLPSREAVFYLVAVDGSGHYGLGSSLFPRVNALACP